MPEDKDKINVTLGLCDAEDVKVWDRHAAAIDRPRTWWLRNAAKEQAAREAAAAAKVKRDE